MATNFTPANATDGHQTVFDGDEAIYLQTDPGGTPGDKYATPDDFAKNHLYLYKLSVSVTSNNLTVALVDLDGNAASATNPIRVKIGDVEHTLSAALSVTAAAATNWCNAGGAELATQSVRYFAYLGYNATDGVTIGFSRIPYAVKYSDFSTTSTDNTFCKISNIANAGASDAYQNIGYFEATLSAGAGYTWSSPTNVISSPRHYTRALTYAPVWSASTPPAIGNGTITGRYTITGAWVKSTINIIPGSTTTFGSGTYTFSQPFAAAAGSGVVYTGTAFITDGSGAVYVGFPYFGTATSTPTVYVHGASASAITATAPITLANGDQIVITSEFSIA